MMRSARVAWTAPRPLTAAERRVDFPAHLNLIERERSLVESGARPATKRLAHQVAELRMIPLVALNSLENRLYFDLNRALSFGYRSARAELKAEVVHAYAIPDAGRFAIVALGRLAAIRELVRARSRETARQVGVAASGAIAGSQETDKVLLAITAGTAAFKTLHNSVLELVGETLNLGRTAGALSAAATYAMRSEQLDQNTCEECDVLHGEIYEVDSADYYDNLPPEGCLGGGRCRGIMVYGYESGDVAQPLDEAA